jgi:uncharacterized protein with PQ loop repeat
LAAFVLAFAMAGAFAVVPWEELSAEGFPDRDNYVATIGTLVEDGVQSFQFEMADIFALLLNEYLWREILIAIANSFDEPIDGLMIVSFIAVAMAAMFILRRAGLLYALLFLVCPLTIDLFVSQTRSALALALFTVGLCARRQWLRYGLMIAAFMVHSVGALLLAIFLSHQFVLARSRISSRVKLGIAAALGAGVSVVWVFLSSSIFAVVGDRRADQDAMTPASLTFALLWIAIVAIVMMFSRLHAGRDSGQSAMLTATLLCTFVFGTLFGVGALRFLALALPFVFVAIRSIREPVVRTTSLTGIVVFNLIHATYWMR